MDKGISFYFGWDINPNERAKMIKETGFTSVITCADKNLNAQNGKISSQVKLFKKYGLKLSSLHFSYKTEDLHNFWLKGKFGEKLKKSLIKDIKIAKKYGFSCVVVHLVGEYSSVGERRLREGLKVCDKTGIPIAIENVLNQKLFVDTFNNINHDKLKFCYDVGHNNAFDKEFDYLSKYGNKLVALHLHDNDGIKDLHTISKYKATVNWNEVALKLANCPEVLLDYELLNKLELNTTAEEFLKDAYLQACDLEEKINHYKNIKNQLKIN